MGKIGNLTTQACDRLYICGEAERARDRAGATEIVWQELAPTLQFQLKRILGLDIAVFNTPEIKHYTMGQWPEQSASETIWSPTPDDARAWLQDFLGRTSDKTSLDTLMEQVSLPRGGHLGVLITGFVPTQTIRWLESEMRRMKMCGRRENSL